MAKVFWPIDPLPVHAALLAAGVAGKVSRLTERAELAEHEKIFQVHVAL